MSAQTFIGRQISLTSSSDIRYTGTLEGIDQQSSTITLKNVFSMGTEHRRPPGQPDYIPPSHQPYEQIVFKAANVKDISVDDHAPRPLPNDPAVLSGQAGPQQVAAYPAYGAAGFAPQPQAQQVYNNVQPQVPLHAQQNHQQQTGNRQQRQPRAPSEAATNGRPPRGGRQQDGVRAAEASLETGGGHRGGRGGHRAHDSKPTPVPVPDVDFDFQQSNARFNKAALAPPRVEEDEKTNPSDSESDDKSKERDKYYNPQKSFFDGLSAAPAPPPPGNRGGRRGRGGGGRGRNRREEEREKNISTFGEPGGVGIMGPGAYVAGWGGSHGGRRGRGGGNHVAQGATTAGTGTRR